jgi:Tubulin-tyrosine ligase family
MLCAVLALHTLSLTANAFVLLLCSASLYVTVQSCYSAVRYSDQVVLQRYLAEPLLLDGYKFDLRIYVLVTSFNPLEAFIYREGFARLSTRLYSTSAGDVQNRYVHLTNSSIQVCYICASIKHILLN